MSKFELTHKTLDADYIERFFLGTPSKNTELSTMNKSSDNIDNVVNDYKNKLLSRSSGKDASPISQKSEEKSV